MRKRIYFVLFSILLSQCSISQTVNIDWVRMLGGSQNDKGNFIYQANSNSFYLVGESESNDGDVIGLNHGGNSGSLDLWVSNIDSSGNFLWTRLFGGSSEERGYSIVRRSNGNFLVCGSASSNQGDVSGLHTLSPFGGRYDVWITEIDSLGSLLWQHCYGSTQPESGKSILNTIDSGFVFLGSTSQGNDSDVTGGHGDDDFWIARCDKQGAILWAKCFGGSQVDFPSSIIETTNRGFIFIGTPNSDDGQVIGNHSFLNEDIWVVKIDSNGNILWSKCFGGTSTDAGVEIIPASDNGFYLGANVYSTDYDIQNLHGGSDFWFAKIDSVGNIEHATCIGGAGYELIASVKRLNDGNFIIAGYKIVGANGGNDIYIAKIDSLGSLIWEKNIGGSNDDICYSVMPMDDYNFMITGYSKSNNGIFSGQHGMKDMFLMKLSESPTTVSEQNEPRSISCAYFNEGIHLYFPTENLAASELIICNSLGQSVERNKFTQTVAPNEIILQQKLLPGIYFGRIISPSYNGLFKFVVAK